MARAFMTVGAWTLLSRVLGFGRDILIALFLGAGPAADAFLVAFALPNMFRRFFAEGAFNVAFVPMFSKRIERRDDAEAFARDALTGLGAAVLALVLLAQLFMPAFVLAMASGFAADERLDLAVGMGRIVFPYILFISLAALASGVLNAMGRFWAAAAAPVLLNIVLIAAMGGAALLGGDVLQALVWGVPLAGVAQLALVWQAARRAGITLLPRRPRMTPELRRLALIAAPAALAGGVVQVNLLVGRQVASYTEGAVAWLSYADRLYQLPLGVVGIAIGVVLLPDLSRRLAADDRAGSIATINRATEFTLALTLPAAAALVVIPGPLVSVLFERGAFGPQDSAATAAALAIYGLGLPAFVLQKVVQPVYFAREDTRTPFRFALVAMAVNAALAVGLAPVIGYLAAPVATTTAGWVMFALLLRGARRIDGGIEPDARLRRSALGMLAASGAMALAVGAMAWALAPALDAGGLRYLALAGMVLAGAVVYAGVVHGTGAFTARDMRDMMRRG
ncbi:murein biosynthesis integral membrane protein MurJ [Rhodobacteraceae bacterium 2CG4]|uniref:Probable lipid II flippase MurJ n=1 Tax=Halovulum marinum TaxID=2662447 RepID=A0A6L5Z0Q8_9RHOB|nr:murein biosynthesis integral membrane protein MurJ [Halovulum marinum]MSU89554.1 murein biosynthesis integral membrane protein MurJ [Halovulum marinum]